MAAEWKAQDRLSVKPKKNNNIKKKNQKTTSPKKPPKNKYQKGPVKPQKDPTKKLQKFQNYFVLIEWQT